MNKQKVNRIHAVMLICLGILSILLGLFDNRIPHGLQLAASIVQILAGAAVLCTSIIKLKGKF